jgi:phage tail-like protein
MQMAGDKSEQQIWPLPKFYFVVEFGDGNEAKFQEVTGLDTEAQPIEFRHGTSPVFAPIKMPGVHKAGDVTMRRGVVAGDSDIWNWLKQVNAKTPKRRTVTVNLNEATGKPVRVWRLNNAWPTKVTAGNLKAEGNDVAIESLELAHEGIDLESA